MRVSIIIPVYNEQDNIRECLVSLGKQTLAKELEVIVVDDGSTDNSLAKLH
jgi:glycosyltransferase involved in cell wall biosynthesis